MHTAVDRQITVVALLPAHLDPRTAWTLAHARADSSGFERSPVRCATPIPWRLRDETGSVCNGMRQKRIKTIEVAVRNIESQPTTGWIGGVEKIAWRQKNLVVDRTYSEFG